MFLKGKRALVTGSTSGIGLGMARALAAEGAETVITGFGNKDEIARICAEIGATHIDADLTTVAGAESLMAAAGDVDILVNNAGMQFVSPVEDFPVEKWDQIIALNLSAAFHTIRLAVPYMKQQGWGRIINTASAHSLTASPFKSAYVSAKHGLAGLTKTLALELATHNITANCISPGYMATPLSIDVPRERMENWFFFAPMKRMGLPEELQGAVVYLASEAASYTTGADIIIDGGYSCV